MANRRWLRALGPALLLSIGGAYAVASFNWCGRWIDSPPQLISSEHGEGPLLAGAAKSPILPPYPIVRAGYGPVRSDVSKTELPLYARALVLQQGDTRVGIVSLELLLVPGSLSEEVRAAAASLGLDTIWVLATHTHSSLGGFDDRLVSELAGTGRFRDDARAAVRSAAIEALRGASGRLEPARLDVQEAKLGDEVYSRVGGAEPERRAWRLRVLGEGRTIAEWIETPAHATLEGRSSDALSPDYPGWVSAELEQGGAVALVSMGAVGNTSVGGGRSPEAYAAQLVKRLGATAGVELGPQLGFARVNVTLPRPDASRLVPRLVRRAGENFLCASSSRTVELSALRLGPWTLIAVPGEVTTAAAPLFEPSPQGRVVSLVNDYVGYIERPETVDTGGGESRRQYFDRELATRLGQGAQVAVKALEVK